MVSKLFCQGVALRQCMVEQKGLQISLDVVIKNAYENFRPAEKSLSETDKVDDSPPPQGRPCSGFSRG